MSETPKPSGEKEIQIRIPADLWEDYEAAAPDLRSPSDSHLFGRLLEIFLRTDSSTQLEVLYSKNPPILINPDGPALDNGLLEGNWP